MVVFCKQPLAQAMKGRNDWRLEQSRVCKAFGGTGRGGLGAGDTAKSENGAGRKGRDAGFSRGGGGGGGKVTGRERRVLPLGRCGRERRRRQEAGGVQVKIKGGAGRVGRSKDGRSVNNARRALA